MMTFEIHVMVVAGILKHELSNL